MDYAVEMRRLPDSARGDVLLAEGRLSAAQIDALAAHLAVFHGSLASTAAIAAPFGSKEAIERNVTGISGKRTTRSVPASARGSDGDRGPANGVLEYAACAARAAHRGRNGIPATDTGICGSSTCTSRAAVRRRSSIAGSSTTAFDTRTCARTSRSCPGIRGVSVERIPPSACSRRTRVRQVTTSCTSSWTSTRVTAPMSAAR